MRDCKVMICRHCKKLLAFSIPAKNMLLMEFPHNRGSSQHDKRHGTQNAWSYL